MSECEHKGNNSACQRASRQHAGKQPGPSLCGCEGWREEEEQESSEKHQPLGSVAAMDEGESVAGSHSHALPRRLTGQRCSVQLTLAPLTGTLHSFAHSWSATLQRYT